MGKYVPKILDQANDNIDKQMEELMQMPWLLYNSNEVLSILRKDNTLNFSELNNDVFTVNSYLSRTYFNGSNAPLLGVFVWSKSRLYYSTTLPYFGFEQEPDFQEKGSIILQHETDLHFEYNKPFFLIKKEIWDSVNFQHVGMMLIAVDFSLFNNVLFDIKQQNEAETWVMNPQGEVIYDTNARRIGSIVDLNYYPIKNGSFRSSHDGNRRLISVSQSGQTEWILVHSIPFEYLTNSTKLIRDVTALLVVIFVLITGLISIYAAWNVSRPIDKLSSLMRDVEKGYLQVDLRVDSRDEIGLLARSFNSMVSRIKDLIQQNYHIELRQKQAELYALQSQINPHFMYNTLETISMAVEDDEKETVVDMVTLLGKMLRFSLSNKDRIVTLHTEVEHIRNYLSIQKYRFEHRLNFDIQSDIDLNHYYSPKFILQPIIENCIMHGLETRKGLTIRIHITKVSGIQGGMEEILMSVQDDGIGMDQETLEKIRVLLESDPIAGRDSGFGLSNVHARMVMMFGPDYGLRVESKLKEGTTFYIRIPVIEDMQTVNKYERNEV